MEWLPTLIVALLSGAFALAGVLLKAMLDRTDRRGRAHREDARRFEEVRLQAIVEFLQTMRSLQDQARQIHRLAIEVAKDPELEDGELPPAGAMEVAVGALERLRLTAHSLDVIRTAESLVKHVGALAEIDRSIVLSGASQHDRMRWEIIWKTMQEVERVFVNAARAELRLGPPSGAPDNYPVTNIPDGMMQKLLALSPHIRVAPDMRIKRIGILRRRARP